MNFKKAITPWLAKAIFKIKNLLLFMVTNVFLTK